MLARFVSMACFRFVVILRRHLKQMVVTHSLCKTSLESQDSVALLQGLMPNSNIYGGCRRTKQQGWWNFPTHIPMSTMEFSNTFQHEYRNFPVNFFTHCGILQHFKANMEDSFQNEYRILQTMWNSPTFKTYVGESPLCWFLASYDF